MEKVIPPESPKPVAADLEYARGRYPNRPRYHKARRELIECGCAAAFPIACIPVAAVILSAHWGPSLELVMLLIALSLIATLVGAIYGWNRFNSPWAHRNWMRLLTLVNAIEFVSLIAFIVMMVQLAKFLGAMNAKT